MKDVFVIAMELEADAVLRHLDGVLRFEECGRLAFQGSFGDEKSAVVVCGVGKVNAAAGTQYAIDRFAPERIVNLGVAGCLHTSLKVADVFGVSKCFQCDFDLSEINPAPKCSPDEYESPFFELEPYDPAQKLPETAVATGDAFSNADPDRDFVYGEMGAWLRDMEVAAIAHVCRRAGVRCCSLKAVSDIHFPDRPAPIDQFRANLARAVDALGKTVGAAKVRRSAEAPAKEGVRV